MAKPISSTTRGAETLDLSRYVRPGDTVVIGQGCGEPGTLVDALMSQRAAIGQFRVYLCTVVSDRFRLEHCDRVEFVATGISAGTRALAAAGAVDVVPSHFSETERLLRDGELPCDVVLLQVSGPDRDGRYSLGATHDYLVTAIRKARVVIAEVNANAPFTFGSVTLSREDFTALVESDSPLSEVSGSAAGEAEIRIAEHVAAMVPDRATIQTGIGGLGDTVLKALRDKRGLGYHGGMMSDAVADLIDCGAIDNCHKGIDPGASVTGVLLGTKRLFDFTHRNPAVAMRSPSYTHAASTFARISRLFSVNSAIEVDLTGQVNAESLGGRHVGAVGGHVDFVRGARLSEGGRSVIALPSTHGRARHSRVVASLNGPVTTARSDVDCVVTEWGVAHLRGQSLRQRIRSMLGIACPEHREQLERAAYELLRTA